jgi:hypothetical protein
VDIVAGFNLIGDFIPICRNPLRKEISSNVGPCEFWAYVQRVGCHSCAASWNVIKQPDSINPVFPAA